MIIRHILRRKKLRQIAFVIMLIIFLCAINFELWAVFQYRIPKVAKNYGVTEIKVNQTLFYDANSAMDNAVYSEKNFFYNKGQEFLKTPSTIVEQNNIRINLTKQQITPKIILMYNPLYWWEEWVNNTWGTSDVFRNCPISNCVISKNVSLFKESDAVIFKLQQFNEIPKTKRQEQVWISAQFEPPPLLHHPHIYEKYRNLINWTLSYRRDSDFTVTHGQFKKFSHPSMSFLNASMNAKTKLALIFNSDCDTQSKREEYIRMLKQSIPVDIYGFCGDLKCSGWNRFSDAWNMKNKTSTDHDSCFSMLDTEYKFYLSFENSLCRDYITEKGMDMVLRHKIVPIIWSGANLSLYLPPESYIDTHSPYISTNKIVADQIKYLGSHEKFYNQFFLWRKYYYTVGMLEGWNREFCKLCDKLHNPGKHKKLYSDIYDWIYKDGHRNVCYEPQM